MRYRALAAAGLACAVLTARTSLVQADEKEACASAAEEAQLLMKQQHMREARERLLVCVRPVCPKIVQADCKQWLDDVQSAESPPPPPAPGTKSAPPPPSVASPPPPLPPPSTGEMGSPPPATEPPATETGQPSRVAPWLLGGAGVAAMGVGAVLWLVGRSERSDLFDRCGTPGTCTSDDIDSSKSASQTKLVVGDVAFGLGLAAVVGAAVWLVTSAGTRGQEKVSVSVLPAPGGVAFRW